MLIYTTVTQLTSFCRLQWATCVIDDTITVWPCCPFLIHIALSTPYMYSLKIPILDIPTGFVVVRVIIHPCLTYKWGHCSSTKQKNHTYRRYFASVYIILFHTRLHCTPINYMVKVQTHKRMSINFGSCMSYRYLLIILIYHIDQPPFSVFSVDRKPTGHHRWLFEGPRVWISTTSPDLYFEVPAKMISRHGGIVSKLHVHVKHCI